MKARREDAVFASQVERIIAGIGRIPAGWGHSCFEARIVIDFKRVRWFGFR